MNNKKEGIEIYYNLSSNFPQLTTIYKDGKKNGIESHYSSIHKGKLLYEILFENDIAISGKCCTRKQ